MKTRFLLTTFSVILSSFVFAQTISKSGTSTIPNTVCPVLPVSYNLSAPSSYTSCTRKWVATNGIIIGRDDQTSVSVQWNDTPGAKAKLVCQFSNCGNSNSGTETAPLEELILSVKNQAWGSYGTVVNVDYCTRSQVNLTVPHMYVQGTGGIAQPPLQEVVYSWTLPNGWREVGSGRTGNFGTFINAIAIEPISCSVPGSVSVRGIINVPPIGCGSAGASAVATVALNSVSPLATVTVPQGYAGSTACNTSPVTFSAFLSPSLGCVSSYVWSYPTSWSFVSQSGNNITLRPSGIPADSNPIRATVNFSCGSSVLSGSYTPSYTQPIIVGPAALCSSATYSISNTVGVSANWSSSNTGIMSINSSGVATRNGSAKGAVTINAVLPCPATVSPVNIWVGEPIINSSYVSLNELEQCEHWMLLGANVSPTSNNGITRFHWTENDPAGYSTSIAEGTTMVADIYAPPLAGISRTVYAFASNACSSPIQLGSKEYEYRDWDTCTSPPPYGCGAFVCLTSFPNPTSNELTVSFKGNSDNIKENKTKKTKQSGTAQVRIFDENQKNWISISAKDNEDLKIPVSQLPKGTYYLDVSHSKGDHFRKRIVIE